MCIYAYNGSDRISVRKTISMYDLFRFLRILHISICFASDFSVQIEMNNESNQNLRIFCLFTETCNIYSFTFIFLALTTFSIF